MSSGAHVDPSNKKIALQIAILAVVLAFSETLGKGAQTAALSYNIEASNLWSFFQAKTLRQTTMRTAAEALEAQFGRQGERRGKKADRHLEEDRRALPVRARDQRGAQRTRRACQESGGEARQIARFLSPLRSGLGRGADCDCPRLGRSHYQCDRAGMGVGRAGCRGRRLLPDRLLLADGGAPFLGHARAADPGVPLLQRGARAGARCAARADGAPAAVG